MMTRARLISLAMIAISPLITAIMSIAFYGEVRGGMLVTSVVCAIVIDRIVQRITRHYRARLSHAYDSLEQRAATVGMVAAGVSHEIRNPLTVIRFALDAAAAELDRLDPETRALVTDAGDAATRIEVILRDLMSLARPADDPVTATDLGATIDSAIRLASYRLGKGAQVERAAIDVPPVMANASRLVQVFLNLIVNAARATRPGAPNRIRIAAIRRDDQVVVSVSDTGCGMSAEVQAKLFQPFFTTGRESGGTGLGLVICRTMVERMGGTLRIESEVGAGTTVEVALVAGAAQPALLPARAIAVATA